MCGLFGVFGKTLDINALKEAHNSIKHRGPDDFHYVKDDNKNKYTLAAVRLAFQDIERGRQPIEKTIDKSKIIISFNGEIYNFRELSKEINLRGINLKTKSDTEVLLEMYLIFGKPFIKKLRGMFSISIWDERYNKGFLFSDFLSQKPLFYLMHNNCLFYASELNALKIILELNQIEDENINKQALTDILSLSCITNGETIYKNIDRLKPSQEIEYDYINKTIKRKTFIDLTKYSNTNDLDEEKAIDKIRELLIKAVDKRIDKSKSQAVYLSGGLDSSIVASICRELYPNIEINSFNLNYVGSFNEKEKIKDAKLALMVSKIIKSKHHNIKVNPENLDNYLERITALYGEPFVSVPSMWFVAEEIKKYSKYSLSGDGADELFGSYYTHRRAFKEKPKNFDENLKIIAKYYISFLNDDSDKHKFDSLFKRLIADKDFLNREQLEENPIRNQLFVESKILFPYKVLNYIDRLSMAHSVEPRSPFLDKDLWEFCMTLNDRFRINNQETKYILKKVAEFYLPKEVIYRKKEGFVFPLYPYLVKNKTEIKQRIYELVDSDIQLIPSYINRNWISKSFNDIEENKRKEYKKSQILHSLNVISIWRNLSKIK
tara:strand:- start:6903 stop:8717 length:1815 start_codon:yes stop_codon:yes gene_type:complete